MTQTPELHLKSEKGVNIRFYIHLSSPKSYTVKLVFKALPCWFSKMEQVVIQTTAAPWENMLTHAVPTQPVQVAATSHP